jgi:hypothetical protein
MWLCLSWTDLKSGAPAKNFLEEAPLFDRLYGIGPGVFSDRYENTALALVNLRGLEKYWQLDTFPNALDTHGDARVTHVFLDKLQELRRDFSGKDLKFVVAPSAVWARALSFMAPSFEGVRYFSLPQILEDILPACSPLSLKYLIDDLRMRSVARDLEFRFFCEALKDFNFQNAAQLLLELRKNCADFVQRFGSLMLPLCKRAFLELDDYALDSYQPVSLFEHSIELAWETQASVSPEKDILERVEYLFNDWQLRAESRKVLFRYVDVFVKSERRSETLSQRLVRVKPSRESKSWVALFREFWSGAKDQKFGWLSEYPDEVSEISFRTSALEPDKDIQLNLFNPQEEELSEQWHSLVSRLHARALKSSQLRVGTYVPQASFVPEKALTWKEWSDVDENVAMVPDYPQRPQLLLSRPLVFSDKTFKDYEEYLFFLESKNAILSLEKISNPWGAQGYEERSYARVEEKWIYWDHCENIAFLHGYFEV